MKKLTIYSLLFTLFLLIAYGILFGVKIVPILVFWKDQSSSPAGFALYILFFMFFIYSVILLISLLIALIFEILSFKIRIVRPLYFVFGVLNLNPFLILIGIKYNKLNNSKLDE